MKKNFRNVYRVIIIISLIISSSLSQISVLASEKPSNNIYKVALFPMSGFNMIDEEGNPYGVDVDYLNALNPYFDGSFEYVNCDSWQDALNMLSNHEVDLVGSAQFSEERNEIYDYACIPTGFTYGAIATKADKSIDYEDFEAFANLRYGLVDGYIKTNEFYEYLSENGINNPNVNLYSNTEQLYDAINSNEIDAIVHTFTEVREEMNIIGDFAPNSYYYITYKGNDELINELDKAIVSLKLHNPGLESSLMSSYYSKQIDNSLILSRAEHDYVKNNPVLRVGYIDDHYPFSYTGDNELKGLILAEMNNIANKTGFKIEYIPINNNNSDIITALNNKTIDVLSYNTLSDEEIIENSLVKTRAFTDIPLVLVKNEYNTDDDYNEIAVIPELETEARQALDSLQRKFIYYPTQQDCMKALALKKVDAAICDGYLAEYLIGSSPTYSELVIKTALNKSHIVNMIITSDADSCLESILTKTIINIDSKDVSEYVLAQTPYSAINVITFIKTHQVAINIAMLIITLLIIAALIRINLDRKKINKLLYKDYTLDVWNMNYLDYIAKQHISSNYSREKHQHVIAAIDVANFRMLNNIYGRERGEELLQVMIKNLNELVSDDEYFAREYGDRFIIFLSADTTDALYNRLLAFRQKLEDDVKKHTGAHLDINLGVALISQNATSIDSAVANATYALDVAGNEKSHIKIYDDEFEAQLKKSHDQENLLANVNIEENFIAFYQIKVDIRNNEIVGAEALARFCGPATNGEVKAPYYFVPYYEKTGRLTELDFVIFEDVCKMLQRRISEHKKVVTISVNFSRLHFMKPGFTKKFLDMLEKYNIPRYLIEVEITETLVVDNLESSEILKTIHDLVAEGIRLSIDDFGSGYSSLGIFEQIPASVIKLDRSFLLNENDHDRQVAIMKGIVKIGYELGAQIVCEGIETESNIELMKEIGANVAQGYYYSKPIPVNEFENKLDNE